jgi:hypothetical protein
MSHNLFSNATGVGLAVLAICVSPSVHAQLLGTASDFAVLGGTPAVTNTGPTIVTGSVGVSPAASITGFPPGTIAPGTGTFHTADAVAAQAQADTTAAYLALAALPSAAAGPALGGLTLTPGVYGVGAATLTGTLTLNGPGLYVLQATSLTTASGPGGAVVNLINGATPCDVWWQVGSSAAIGTFAAMQGNFLALTSITIGTSASVQGRVLARNGTVTLDTNAVTACAGGSTPGFVVPFGGPLGGGGGPAGAGIPTLSQWAMILLGLILAGVGFAAQRGRLR